MNRFRLIDEISIYFLNKFWSPLVRRHLFDHLLRSIFQSSLHILHITNHAGPSVWAVIHVLHSRHFLYKPPKGPGILQHEFFLCSNGLLGPFHFYNNKFKEI